MGTKVLFLIAAAVFSSSVLLTHQSYFATRIKLNIGDTMTLNCPYHEETLRVIWSYDNNVIAVGNLLIRNTDEFTLLENNSLMLENVTFSNEGFFTCSYNGSLKLSEYFLEINGL